MIHRTLSRDTQDGVRQSASRAAGLRHEPREVGALCAHLSRIIPLARGPARDSPAAVAPRPVGGFRVSNGVEVVTSCNHFQRIISGGGTTLAAGRDIRGATQRPDGGQTDRQDRQTKGEASLSLWGPQRRTDRRTDGHTEKVKLASLWGAHRETDEI